MFMKSDCMVKDFFFFDDLNEYTVNIDLILNKFLPNISAAPINDVLLLFPSGKLS